MPRFKIFKQGYIWRLTEVTPIGFTVYTSKFLTFDGAVKHLNLLLKYPHA